MLWYLSFLSICLAIRECCYTPPCPFERECETDFVIVGVGAAGSVLAKRLTDPNPDRKGNSFSAIGLEWGEYHNDDIEVKSISNPSNPFQFVVPSLFPEWSDDYMSAPDAGLLNKQIHIQYGRMLGGSGNHNYAYAVHPSPRLLDEDWVPVGGNEWSSESITQVINNFETYTGATDPDRPRGTNGPIHVQAVQLDPNPTSFGNVFFQSLADNLPAPDANTPIVKDGNAGWNTYINNAPQFFYRFTQDEILRSSPGLDYTNTSVLNPKGYGVGGRKLRVKFGALVDKLLFTSRKKAIGVQYIHNGESKIVYARKEIILTALAINTPVILQRSGYGPASLLESFGIEVVYDNPHVGQNLRNHYGGSFIVASNLDRSVGFIAQHAYLSILPEVNGRRLVQVLCSPGLAGTGSDAFDAALGLNDLPAGWFPYGFLNFIVYPASAGSVQLTSTDPSIQPTVFPGFFSDSTGRDIRAIEQTLFKLYDNVNHLLETYPESFKVIYPPASAFESGDIRKYIQGLPSVSQHWGGSCAIGSVVDEKLSLIGVQGVTIADISVAPMVNDGNTQTMANFIAEKAAKFLLEKYSI